MYPEIAHGLLEDDALYSLRCPAWLVSRLIKHSGSHRSASLYVDRDVQGSLLDPSVSFIPRGVMG